MNSASLCSLAGRYDNDIPTRFLAPIDCLKIPAQLMHIGGICTAQESSGTPAIVRERHTGTTSQIRPEARHPQALCAQRKCILQRQFNGFIFSTFTPSFCASEFLNQSSTVLKTSIINRNIKHHYELVVHTRIF